MVDAEQARRLRKSMTEQLSTKGDIKSTAWRDAFMAVPRHVFTPEFWAVDGTTRRRVTPSDPRCLELVYADEALATQMTGKVVTSSSTAPGLMAVMLESLDISAGNTVLEIATGTGYNAALLAACLGDDRVTTVEVDPELAEAARGRLREAGYSVHVVSGDGRLGHAPGAPYDRLIATCGFSAIPPVWVEQVRPGGVIVSPLGSGVVRLDVLADGRACGRFLPAPAYFMSVRDAGATGTAPHPGRPTESRQESASLGTAVSLVEDEAFRFLVSLAVPDTASSWERDADGRVSAVELWAGDGSWARFERRPGLDGGTVQQAGPRDLWRAVEDSAVVFEEHDRPGRDRYGVTVEPDGQCVWLDTPEGECWTLPTEGSVDARPSHRLAGPSRCDPQGHTMRSGPRWRDPAGPLRT